MHSRRTCRLAGSTSTVVKHGIDHYIRRPVTRVCLPRKSDAAIGSSSCPDLYVVQALKARPLRGAGTKGQTFSTPERRRARRLPLSSPGSWRGPLSSPGSWRGPRLLGSLSSLACTSNDTERLLGSLSSLAPWPWPIIPSLLSPPGHGPSSPLFSRLLAMAHHPLSSPPSSPLFFRLLAMVLSAQRLALRCKRRLLALWSRLRPTRLEHDPTCLRLA
jgi:hypothetical protein